MKYLISELACCCGNGSKWSPVIASLWSVMSYISWYTFTGSTEKICQLRARIHGWYKKEGDKTRMDGWMHVAMMMTFELCYSIGTRPIVTETIWSAVTIGAMCLLIVRVQRTLPWKHPSIYHGFVSLLFYHPYILPFVELSPFFIWMHTLYFILRRIYCQCNVFEASLHTSCAYVMLLELCSIQ